jgi:hypothetical protein
VQFSEILGGIWKIVLNGKNAPPQRKTREVKKTRDLAGLGQKSVKTTDSGE